MLRYLNFLSLILCFTLCITTLSAVPDAKAISSLDSLSMLLQTDVNKAKRLGILHHACKILYEQDSDHERLITYAKEGVEIAISTDDVEMGSDLAVWILRANIYLRSYDDNPIYYSYLKELYQDNKIEKKKYIQPLYSEVYSYIDYGKLKEAEERMGELEPLIDKEDSKQHLYYLDLYIAFKRKGKEHKAAADALAEFALEAKKINDPRFEIIALSRNAEFYLDDSINYQKSKDYAFTALELVKESKANQYEQPILLQLSKAYYQLEEFDKFESTYKQISLDSIAKIDKIVQKDYFTFTGDLEYDKKQYNPAIRSYIQAVQFLETSDFASMEVLTKKIEKCYVKIDDFESAYKYANRLNVLQDSLYNDENIKALKVFQSRLKLKDAETERIKLENKIHAQKKSTLYIGFFSSLILLSLLFYNRLLDEKVKIRTAALDDRNIELKSSLEELEQFNYIASHDIKEPMRVVSSVTGLIEKKMAPEMRTKFASEFGLVKNSITQLYTLIEDLSQFLDLKSGSLKPEMTNTNELMDQVQQMLSKAADDKNATITYDGLPNIYTCPSLLTVIMKNLVENGIKYNENEAPNVHVSYSKDKERHIYSIRDNGIGIDKKYHDYVFQMFKRLHHRDKTGSGLGLGLVSKSIEKLGGNVSLESEEGKGSTFIVSLPQTYLIPNNN